MASQMMLQRLRAKRRLVLGALVSGLLPGCASRIAAPDMQSRYQQIARLRAEHMRVNDRAFAEVLGLRCAALFPELDRADLSPLLDRHSPSDLALLLRVLRLLSYYQNSAAAALRLHHFHELLEQADQADQSTREMVFDELLKMRLFELARKLGARLLPSREPVHHVDHLAPDKAGPSMWAVRDSGSWIERISVNSADRRVVVISLPACKFSRRAATQIQQHTDLADAFARHSLWLTPPSADLDLPQFSAWNAQFPSAQQFLLHDWNDWPAIMDWSTPSFYFMQEGRLITQVNGWRDDAQTDALSAALRIWSNT